MKCSSCSEVVQPIVAFDIDGTLGNYHDHLLNFLANYTGKPMRTGWDGEGNWEDYLELPRRVYQDGKLAFRQGGLKRWMPVFDHATQLTNYARSKGAEVWITTTRPYNRLDSVDPDTREWLRRNNMAYDRLLYDEEKYIRLAEIVDPRRVAFVLEDLPAQFEQAIGQFGAAAHLIARPHNSFYRRKFVGASFGDLWDASLALDKFLYKWSEYNVT